MRSCRKRARSHARQICTGDCSTRFTRTPHHGCLNSVHAPAKLITTSLAWRIAIVGEPSSPDEPLFGLFPAMLPAEHIPARGETHSVRSPCFLTSLWKRWVENKGLKPTPASCVLTPEAKIGPAWCAALAGLRRSPAPTDVKVFSRAKRDLVHS
jgi:hypothetical protein